jgi:hypothetical protein
MASTASSEALDEIHWAMHSASYRRIRMATEIASKVGVFFCIIDFVAINNLR